MMFFCKKTTLNASYGRVILTISNATNMLPKWRWSESWRNKRINRFNKVKFVIQLFQLLSPTNTLRYHLKWQQQQLWTLHMTQRFYLPCISLTGDVATHWKQWESSRYFLDTQTEEEPFETQPHVGFSILLNQVISCSPLLYVHPSSSVVVSRARFAHQTQNVSQVGECLCQIDWLIR